MFAIGGLKEITVDSDIDFSLPKGCHWRSNWKKNMFKSGCQRKPGKMLKMSTEGGQQNKFILTS